MVWTPSGWQWLPVLLLIWLTYEALRYTIVSGIKQRYEEQVDRFMREHKIPHDPFRHTHRVVVKERAFNDPGLRVAIAERAKRDGLPVGDVEFKVRKWLDEIVPQFNLLAYYQVGYRIGRTIAYSIYNVRLDQDSLERAHAKVPRDASVVYVSNHRSNADFVVTGFMLSKSVQISYAVGEWARVWPLESLFKAFGSYFVRRGEKDPLYHRTLEAYIQLITKESVTQAMFPEGGLSRDGSMRPVKVGLLDMMARAKLDSDFDRPLVFVPVGINFDRVVEDENMLKEARGERPKKKNAAQKFVRFFVMIGKSSSGLAINGVRFMMKRLKKHGMVAIHFGEPIVFDEWYKHGEPFLDDEDRHERWSKLRPFGDELVHRIGQNIPVTPATLVCHALRSIGEDKLRAGVDRGAVLLAMRKSADRLSAASAPFATGDPYADDLEPMRRQDLATVAAGLDDAEELDRILVRAMDVMEKRSILFLAGKVLRSQRFDLIQYYARSLDSHTRDLQEPEPIPA